MSSSPDEGPQGLEDAVQTSDSIEYWKGIEASINGMLGGIPSVSRTDLRGSKTFLARLGFGVKNGRQKVPRILEGGAGIGRVTTGLLTSIADKVDVIEPVAKFTASLEGSPGVGNIFNTGLEYWEPLPDVIYDLIWIQWCATYLDDESLIKFLERCMSVLNPDQGVIVFKENLSSSGEDFTEEYDGSVTRKDDTFRLVFRRAGLRLVRTELQMGFPTVNGSELLPVRMYALEPNRSS